MCNVTKLVNGRATVYAQVCLTTNSGSCQEILQLNSVHLPLKSLLSPSSPSQFEQVSFLRWFPMWSASPYSNHSPTSSQSCHPKTVSASQTLSGCPFLQCICSSPPIFPTSTLSFYLAAVSSIVLRLLHFYSFMQMVGPTFFGLVFPHLIAGPL